MNIRLSKVQTEILGRYVFYNDYDSIQQFMIDAAVREASAWLAANGQPVNHLVLHALDYGEVSEEQALATLFDEPGKPATAAE